MTGPQSLRQGVAELEPLRVSAAEYWAEIQRFGSQLSFRLTVLLWAGSFLSLGQLGQTLAFLGPASIPSCVCPCPLWAPD